MPSYARVPQILLLICYQVLLSDAACYNPDQSIADPPYYVCNTTTGEHSACCGPGDPCTVNGYCFGSAGYIYRGGCTDVTWQSPKCCPGCRDSAINSFSNVYACPINNGSRTSYWCCGAQEQGPGAVEAGCCETTLFTPDFGVFANAEAVANPTDPTSSTQVTSSSPHTATSPSFVSSPTSSIPSEPTILSLSIFTPTLATVAPSSVPAHSSQKNVAVGAGVGVPVGALSLLGLAFLFLRERRRRIHAQKMTTDAYTAAQEREREREGPTAGGYKLRNHIMLQELESRQRGPNEIDSREVHEANGGF